MVLLIPRIIKEIKEEGRAEALAEGRMAGREEGRVEGRAEGRMAGRAEGRRAERERVAGLRARYEMGEIALDEFMSRIADSGHCEVCGRSG